MRENNREALLKRGFLELENKQYETALATFQQADSLFPDDAEVKYAMFQAFYNLEQYETALQCLDKALAIAPDYKLAAETREKLLVQLREGAYLQLIDALLQCSEGEEGEILAANEHLIDAGLIATIEQVAEYYEQQEAEETSNWLRNLGQYLAQYLEDYRPTQAHYDFLLEILQTINDGGEKEQVYLLLQENIDKLDLKLAYALENLADNTLSQTEDKITKKSLGYLILDFSNFISEFPLGNQANNLEIAITGYNILLNIFTEADSPQDWATTQNNLGNAYGDRIRGDKAENLERAIASYQQALTVYTPQDFPVDWAMTQNNLGTAYWNRIRGDKAENLERAIASYQQALTVYTPQDFPQDWAGTQNNLGLAYGDRIRGDKAENLERAIASYQQALTVYTPQDFPVQWAMTQNNLGTAYCDRIRGDKAENLERAIASYQQALTVYTPQDFPQDWATTQNNLGAAYSDRIRGDKAENLERAIASFQNALTVYTPQDFPVDWATTQNNLGTAYWDRIRGDKAENLERAIASYQQALTVYTPQDFPVQWATTQNNLGTAYCDRIRGDKAENLERAIASYQQALTVRTPQDFPVQWAGTQNNLGTAYCDRIRGDKAENLERAIAFYQQALTVRTPQDFPVDWAMTQNNLGNAYWDRIRGDKAENLERAIASYQQALTVRTPQDFPVDWAATQNNLGTAYWNRIRGDKAENLERAIASYQQALTVRTPQNLPLECLQTSRNLGDLAFNQNNWQLAKKTYSLGIKAVEQSRSWAKDYQRKQEILSDAIEVYQNMVQACIYSGQIEQAIEYIERSKARNLVELLALRDLYPKGDIPQEVINNLDHLRQSIIVEERLLRQQASNINNLEPNRINQLRQQLKNLLERKIKPNDPSFQLTQRVEPISFNQIQNSLPNSQTALVEWYLGKENLSAFIIAQEQIPIQISYTQKQLNALTNKAEEYLFRYLGYIPTPMGYIRISIKFWLLLLNLDCLAGIIFLLEFQWQNKLPHLLTQLAESLQLATIIERIKQIIPDVERLIIVPHRWLHLLPLHALTLPDGQCLLDIFLQGVSYAPSVQLLSLTQQQEKSTIKNFFAVQNPNNDLPFTDFEVLTIKPLFHPYNDILKRTDATKTALTPARLKKANCAHFSCHGYFNFENPELSALLLAGSQIDKPIEQLTELELSTTRFLPSRDGGSIDLSQCLTLGEIFGLDLTQSRLTVLSACETGLTDFRSLTDEYIGLPSGFLYAGSPNVVSSLWAVNDLSTAFLMIKLYQNLQDNDFHDSVPIALNQAQLWLKNVNKEELEEWGRTLNLRAANQAKFETAMAQYEANSRPFASPYYWAAFYAVGY
ncbi:MAG: tetratricopeptide repeat protein [Xenococcaceae cyanobacterium MO_167.B27]|nr:tetratricopeptide repeat protein [Xenococcaceae cyanobacterium MO_167.B27]